jgi:hypothetical protein
MSREAPDFIRSNDSKLGLTLVNTSHSLEEKIIKKNQTIKVRKNCLLRTRKIYE